MAADAGLSGWGDEAAAAGPNWELLLHEHWINDQAVEGLAIWERARQVLPPEHLPYLNYGNLLRDFNAFEQADAAYTQARRLGNQGHRISVAWNQSQILIGLEDYERAFAMAEERLLQDRSDLWRAGPYWQGWSASAAAMQASGIRSITVWTEQGIGDSLQYLRWIPLLMQRGHAVRLEVDPPLLPLFRAGLAWLGQQLDIVPKGIDPSPLNHGCQGSLMSLPALLGGAPLPGAFAFKDPGHTGPTGYLRSQHWQPPDPGRARPRIGLVWATGRKLDDPFLRREYERRSIPAVPLAALLRGLEALDVDLISLQFGPDRQRAALWQGRFAASLNDEQTLADTAEWVAGLDLVISVDTAMAHLAGAMAHPAWVLLPWAADPRWLRQRLDSPWYPTLTLLRQPQPGDWSALVSRLLDRFQSWRRAWSRQQPCSRVP